MTKELFQKYTEGRCNLQEGKEVEEWLRTCQEYELNQLMLQIWNDPSNRPMPPEQTDEMWKKLSSIVTQKPAGRVINMFPRKKWVAAAAAVAIFITAMIFTFQKKQQLPALAQETKAVIQAPDSNIIDWSEVVNTNSKNKTVILDDGSKVTLFTASSLTYRTKFGAESRDIFLDGKALFEVAKDSERPFTVHSGAIATTALGTKFLVDAGTGSSAIHVKLYEGKIVVKSGKYAANSWAKQEFLLPGDEFRYDINNRTTAVNHESKADKKENSKALRLRELVFNNEELEAVFQKMKEEYHIDIVYSKADITGMYFTGSISQTSSLSGTLRIITQMNGLNLKEENGKYIIRKEE